MPFRLFVRVFRPILVGTPFELAAIQAIESLFVQRFPLGFLRTATVLLSTGTACAATTGKIATLVTALVAATLVATTLARIRTTWWTVFPLLRRLLVLLVLIAITRPARWWISPLLIATALLVTTTLLVATALVPAPLIAALIAAFRLWATWRAIFLRVPGTLLWVP